MNVEICKTPILQKSLMQYGAPHGGSKEKMIERLKVALQESTKHGVELLVCDFCKGSSPSTLSECPFCGDDPSPEAVVAVVVKSVTASKEASKPKKEAPKKMEMVHVKTQNGKAVRAVDVAKGEQRLDDANGKTRELQLKGALAYWELGKHIKQAYFDGALWKLRVGADGKPKYRSFERFIASELEMSVKTARHAMAVSEQFTMKQAESVSLHKLSAILDVPEAKQSELLQLAKKGVPFSELKEKAKKARGGKGRGSPSSKTHKATQASADKAAERAKSQVTAVFETGKFTAPMYGPGGKKLAEKLEAGCVAKVRASNGVAIYVKVEKSDGKFQLTYEAIRDTESDGEDE